MAENSAIEWTDHTFSPWWGCVKVNSTCANCYAEKWDKRWSTAEGGSHWGPRQPRRMILGEWSKPAKWNRDAIATYGRRARVFCASMCDLFEDYDGAVVNQQGQQLYFDCDGGDDFYVAAVTTKGSPVPVTIDRLRKRTFALIDNTPNLHWLLLTKRPANVLEMVPPWWLDRDFGAWPENVMTGYSAGNQEDLEGRHKNAEGGLAELLQIPGDHFLSIEPLTENVDLVLALANLADEYDWLDAHEIYGECELCGGEGFREYLDARDEWGEDCPSEENHLIPCRGCHELQVEKRVWVARRTIGGSHLWVIVGAESDGKRANRFQEGYEAAARSLMHQCRRLRVPFFHKQMPIGGMISHDPEKWPEDLRVRQWPDLVMA